MDLLLDANFLVLPFQQKLDLFSEFDRLLGAYQVYTLNRTYNEALHLQDGRYSENVERFVEEKDIDIVTVDSDEEVDDILIELAGDYVVCTNDSEVRKELREMNSPHIYLRGGDHLEAENLQPSAF